MYTHSENWYFLSCISTVKPLLLLMEPVHLVSWIPKKSHVVRNDWDEGKNNVFFPALFFDSKQYCFDKT